MSIKRVTWDKAIGQITVAVAYNDLNSTVPPDIDIAELERRILDNNSQPIYYLGLIYSLNHNIPKAMDFFDRVISLDPTFVNAYLSKGDCLLQTRDIPGAVMTFTQAFPYCKNNRQIGLVSGKIGYSYYISKEYLKAVEYFKKSLSFSPKSPEWLNNLGCCHLLSGNVIAGTSLLQQAPEYPPQYQIIEINYAFSKLLRDGVKNLPEFVINYIFLINDRKRRRKIVRHIISDFEIKGKDLDCDPDYIGICYFLIGDIDTGATKIGEINFDKKIVISDSIKEEILNVLLEHIKNDISNFEKYNFSAILAYICGPEFILHNLEFESSQDIPIQTLTTYCNYLCEPSYENLNVIADLFRIFPIKLQILLKSDPIFQRALSDVSRWETEADNQYRYIITHFEEIERKHIEGHKVTSIFEDVISAYRNILIYDPGNIRVIEKLACVYSKMGPKWTAEAIKLYMKLLENDPDNERVKEKLRQLPPLQIRSPKQNDPSKINKSRKRRK